MAQKLYEFTDTRTGKKLSFRSDKPKEELTKDVLRSHADKYYASQEIEVSAEQLQQEPSLKGFRAAADFVKTGDVENLPPIIKTPKSTAQTLLKAAPWTVGMVPVLGPPVTAASETGLGLLEGQSIPKSLKRGATAGGIEAALVGFGKPIKALSKVPGVGKIAESGILGAVAEKGMKGIGKVAEKGKSIGEKVGKQSLKLLTKYATQADKEILDFAIKNPKYTRDINEKENIDIALDLTEGINKLRKKSTADYNKGFKSIPAKDKRKPIKTKNISKYIFNQKENLDPNALIREIKKNRPKTQRFDEDSLLKMFLGDDITLEEAKRINSVLGDLSTNFNLKPTDKRIYGNIRGELQKSLETIKEFKKVNKIYSKQKKLIDGLEKGLADKQGIVQESKVNSLINNQVKNLKGERETKGTLFKLLEGIDKELGNKIGLADQIKANALQTSLSKSQGIQKGIAQSIGAFGVLGAIGAATGNPGYFATAMGLIAGQKALKSKPAAKSLLRKSQDVQAFGWPGQAPTKKTIKKAIDRNRPRRTPTIEELSSISKRAVSKVTGQQIARNQDGSYTEQSKQTLRR